MIRTLSASAARPLLFCALCAPPALGHVTLLEPNGGNQLQVGSITTIRWQNTIPHQLVDWDLQYSTNGSQGPWVELAVDLQLGSNQLGEILTYDWVVPQDLSSTVRVRVRQDNVGMDYYDASDSDLAIVSGLGTSYCGPAVANSSGAPAQLFVWGSSTVADQDLHLTAIGLPVNEYGYFLHAPDAALVVAPGGAAGNLCLGGGVGRHLNSLTNSGPEGLLSGELDLSAWPRPSGPIAVQPGETWRLQAWFRDGASSNFTDAVELAFD